MHTDDRQPDPSNTIRDLEPPEAADAADVRGGGLSDVSSIFKPPPPIGGTLGVLAGFLPPPPPPPPPPPA